jgi:hypothetical protein
MSDGTIRPFQVVWDEALKSAVMRQVADYALPAEPPGADWSIGCSGAFLKEIQTHWLERFDWEAAAARLNAHPSSWPRWTASTSTMPGSRLRRPKRPHCFFYMAGPARTSNSGAWPTDSPTPLAMAVGPMTPWS